MHAFPVRVLLDANVCITLIQALELNILNTIANFEFYVPDEVVGEVIRPGQAQALRVSIDTGIITQISIIDQAELLLYAQIRDERRLGAGESACIALAEVRGWSVATDEQRRCRAEIVTRLGVARLFTTADLRRLASGVR